MNMNQKVRILKLIAMALIQGLTTGIVLRIGRSL